MLFLGGRRELAGPPTVPEAVGEGLEVDMMSRELGDCIRSKILIVCILGISESVWKVILASFENDQGNQSIEAV